MALEAVVEYSSTLARELANDSSLQVDALYPLLPRTDETVPEQILVMRELPENELKQFVTNAVCTMRRNTTMGQHPKSTIRAPGVVGCSPKTLLAIHKMNILKAYFKLIRDGGDEPKNPNAGLSKNVKTRLYKKFTDLSTLQATRAIPVVEDVRAVRFYWDTGFSIKKTVCRVLLDNAQRNIADLHKNAQKVSGQKFLFIEHSFEKDIKDLGGIPRDEELAIRRPKQPHVLARISHYPNGSEHLPKPVPITAALPCFYDVTKQKAPLIEPLSDYNIDDALLKDQRWIARIETAPVIEHLHVYRYYPQFRKMENKNKETTNTADAMFFDPDDAIHKYFEVLV
ncbi:MAG: DNA replication terminus site-binding protein [Pseudomonadales bacterium]